jgi:clan AA aspartic protease
VIKGQVTTDLEMVIPLTIRGPANERIRIEAVIDSGFDGRLSLPPDMITRLDLPWRRRGEALLADGSLSVFDIFEGTIIWDRRPRVIPIDEADTDPLVGTELLSGYELKARFEPGGEVTIRSVRRRG